MDGLAGRRTVLGRSTSLEMASSLVGPAEPGESPPGAGTGGSGSPKAAPPSCTQYTYGMIRYFTFATYRSHNFPYFARQTLSSSAWRVNRRPT